MAVYIPMRKTKEKDNWVWYAFRRKTDPMPYIDERGREYYKYKERIGVFKFNKITDEILFEEKETDPYFFVEKIILVQCLVVMKKCKKENKFPDSTCYAA